MGLIYKEDKINTDALRQKLEELEREQDESEVIEDEIKDLIQTSWDDYGGQDETEVVKNLSKKHGINLTEAAAMLTKMPEEPIIDGKTIPDLVKSLRDYRRKLKGPARVKMTNTIDHLIKAYTEHLTKSLDSIYWLTPHRKSVRLLTPSLDTLRKFEYIKDGKTRQEIIDNLIKIREYDMKKKQLDYGKEYSEASSMLKEHRKNVRAILKEISHQSIRKSRQERLDDVLVSNVAAHPGITSNHLHAILPPQYKKSTTPQTIAKMLRKLSITNCGGEYYILSDEIKKDLYSYVAGFIDSDGYITMDSSFSPRVAMIATGNRGKAFFQELEKELSIGRLHLDQKVGENSRSQHRLNFYAQDDIIKLLDKCLPHLRMKQEQGRLLQEAIRIKKHFRKQPWAKERVEQIFKLIKWENWKDSRNQGAVEFEKYKITEEDIVKYKESSKWSLMNEMDSVIKEE